MRKKILVFDFKASEKSFFEKKQFEDFEISFFEFPLNDSTIKQIPQSHIDGAEIVSIFISSALTKAVLNNFKSLKLVSTRATGYNNVDLDECKNREIAVVNVAKYGETTVAQYTFGLLVAMVRKIIPAVIDMKNGSNNAPIYVGRDLNAITLGVLGTGSIGAAFCKIAHGADMKILAYDFKPNPELAENYGVEYVDKETLLKNSDVVSLHVPYNQANHHFISKKELEMMRTGSYLLNTSRGELLDTKELYQALADKKLAGAALDVGECESFSFDMLNFMEKIPNTSADCLARALVTQRLIELPNVILTPHIAYNTQEAIETILESTFKNIDDFYNGLKTNRIV
jgi:D-lactate dehydrogenase